MKISDYSGLEKSMKKRSKLSYKKSGRYLERQLRAGFAQKRLCRCCNGEGYTIVEMDPFEKRRLLKKRRAEKPHWKKVSEEE